MKRTKFRLPWFGDSISKNSGKKLWSRQDSFEEVGLVDNQTRKIGANRLFVFYIASFIILLIFLGRLFHLTVIAGSENRNLAESNRIKLIEREANRGVIYDRRGNALARSANVYLLTGDGEVKEITREQAEQLEYEGLASENFEGDLGTISPEVKREYSLREAAAHVLGYTSEVQEGDLKENGSLSPVQSIGRLGLEQNYNNFLTGKVGKKLVEVDTFGKKVSILGEQESVSGQDIRTTLDGQLQEKAYEALNKQAGLVATKKGAVIVQNPNTGEVLALASVPSFDPEDIGKSVADLEKPFFNRVTQGSYPPGSVFKIVTALAGLESGQIDENTEIEDVGEFELGGSKFSNWFFNKYGKTDGVIKIQKAIARSNDIFFYRVAERIGLKTLRDMAKNLGLGQKTGIDLPAEISGFVPSREWKKSTKGLNWFIGDTYNLSILQGDFFFWEQKRVQLNGIAMPIHMPGSRVSLRLRSRKSW